MVNKILSLSLLSFSVFGSDIQSMLISLKPTALSVEQEGGESTLVLTSSMHLNLNGGPLYIFLAEGWKNQKGEEELFLENPSLVSVTKSFQLNSPILTLISHPDGYISNMKGDKSIIIDEHPEGGIYFKFSPTPSFSFLNTHFDQTQKIEDLKSMDQRIPFVASWVQSHPGYFNKLKACHTASLIDNTPSDTTNIPKVTHTILTRLDTPFISFYLQNNMMLLPKENGWNHVVWAIDPSQYQDLKSLSDNIEIKNISDLYQDDSSLMGYLDTLKSVGYFELSCFLRYYVLNKFGGWYISPDVELIQNLDRFTKPNFVGCIDSLLSPFLSPSFFGSTSNHPILQNCLSGIINGPLKTPQSFGYGKMDAYLTFSDGLYSNAFLESGVVGSDLILGPTSLPTVFGHNPIRTITDPNFKTNLGTMAVHFTQGHWRK